MTPEHFNLLVLTSSANTVLGLLVLSRDPRHHVNRSFALFALAVAIWTITNGLVTTYAGTPSGVIWARLTFASAAAIPLGFLHFAAAFPSRQPPMPRRSLFVLSVLGMVTILLSCTPLIARSTALVGGTLKVTYGPLHLFFGVYFILCLAYPLVFLARKLHVVSGIQKTQVRYVLIAVATAGAGATTTNLLVPLMFGSSRLSPYGPLFGLLLLTIIAHAIIRYRLLNVRLVLRRQARHIVAGALAASVLLVMVQLCAQLLLPGRPSVPLVGISVILAMAVFFDPLKRSLHNALDRYFFREPYSYQQTIRDVTHKMASTLDLQSLLSVLTQTIGETVHAEHVAIYAHEGEQLYERRAVWGDLPIELDASQMTSATAALVAHLAQSKRHVLFDEPELIGAEELHQTLRDLHVHFAVPLVQDDHLAGFLALGPRRSGDPYFAEDVDLVTTLASQAVIAIKNAQLYSQVVHVEAERRRAERLAAVGALASGIAHEIKNPLVAIKAFAELLPERFEDEEFRKEFAAVAGREILRIDELVRRLSGLAASAAERFAPIDVRELIEETIALLRGQLQQAGITATTHYPGYLPSIPGDRSQLKQLFLNVLLNAVEAMEVGGHLAVAVKATYGVRETVIVEVSDEGGGIPGDLLNSLFDPFVTTKPHGTGLGLSISRGIADAHRATIHAQNNEGRSGTTVSIEFPVVDTVTAALKA